MRRFPHPTWTLNQENIGGTTALGAEIFCEPRLTGSLMESLAVAAWIQSQHSRKIEDT